MYALKSLLAATLLALAALGTPASAGTTVCDNNDNSSICDSDRDFDGNPVGVPLPGSLILLAAGAGATWLVRRRR